MTWFRWILIGLSITIAIFLCLFDPYGPSGERSQLAGPHSTWDALLAGLASSSGAIIIFVIVAIAVFLIWRRR